MPSSSGDVMFLASCRARMWALAAGLCATNKTEYVLMRALRLFDWTSIRLPFDSYSTACTSIALRLIDKAYIHYDWRPAVRSVTLNLANKFSQCTFSVAEHYDLNSGVIILRQA